MPTCHAMLHATRTRRTYISTWHATCQGWVCLPSAVPRRTRPLNLGLPLPHLHRDWAHPCHICSSGTGPPSPHLHRDRAPPHLRRDWALPAHICAGIGQCALSQVRPGHMALRSCSARVPRRRPYQSGPPPSPPAPNPSPGPVLPFRCTRSVLTLSRRWSCRYQEQRPPRPQRS
jgi:hypothetical protein